MPLAVLAVLVVRALVTADGGWSARNLVVVNSVGRSASAHLVARNLQAHFSGGSWQCVAMVWANIALFKQVLHPIRCKLYVSPRARWGQFLALLTPALVRPYEHIAILLDDVFVPSSGPYSVSVEHLLRSVRKHSLGGISPAVFGAHPKPMLPLKTGCLRQVRAIETFFTVYTRDAWLCMATILDTRNVGGCGYDFCFANMCPQFRLAVDDRSAVHHMERSPPERYIMRALSPEDKASLPASPSGGAARMHDHTDNPCADADFFAIAARHSCNYSAAFIAWDPADPKWALKCVARNSHP